MLKRNYFMWMIACAMSVTFVACDDDDDINLPPDNEAEIEVSNQVISQNMIRIDEAEVLSDGWVVIHKDNGSNAPVVPGIISVPKQLMAGETEDVMVMLDTSATISGGEKLWAMLHDDTGVQGSYEFNGAGTPDQPLTDNDGNIVMKSFMIESPMIDASGATYDATSHTVTIPSVKAAVAGWLVIHNDDGTGNIVLPGIIGKTEVSAGTTQNVVVQLDQSVTITSGQMLFPMLHIDNGTIGTYEFDGSANSNDPPEIFGNAAFPGNVIFTSFQVQ